MAVNPEIIEYLNKLNITHEVISHKQVFSTIEEAKALGIEADEIAKTLVISTKEKHALTVLPGAQRLDTKKLRDVMGSSHARLMTEEEMSKNFPQYDIGAVPPLGGMLNLPVYIDKKLLDHDTIIFSGGTHTDSVKIKVKDLVEITKANIVDLVKEKTFEATAW